MYMHERLYIYIHTILRPRGGSWPQMHIYALKQRKEHREGSRKEKREGQTAWAPHLPPAKVPDSVHLPRGRRAEGRLQSNVAFTFLPLELFAWSLPHSINRGR